MVYFVRNIFFMIVSIYFRNTNTVLIKNVYYSCCGTDKSSKMKEN